MPRQSRSTAPSPVDTGLTERLDEVRGLLEEAVEDNTALVAHLDRTAHQQAGQIGDVLREVAALRADLDGALAFRALRDLATELIGPLAAIDAMLERADFTDPDVVAGHVRSLSLTLSGVLTRMGAVKVPIDVGAELFDPSRHRCVGTVSPAESPFPGAAPRTVVRVVQDGYLLRDRPLTPATVEIQAGN